MPLADVRIGTVCLKQRYDKTGCKFCLTEHSQKVHKQTVSVRIEQKPSLQARGDAVGTVERLSTSETGSDATATSAPVG